MEQGSLVWNKVVFFIILGLIYIIKEIVHAPSNYGCIWKIGRTLKNLRTLHIFRALPTYIPAYIHNSIKHTMNHFLTGSDVPFLVTCAYCFQTLPSKQLRDMKKVEDEWHDISEGLTLSVGKSPIEIPWRKLESTDIVLLQVMN